MVIAYMLTWATYGTWLQGDRRGWVKKGAIYDVNPALENVNRQQMKFRAVMLTKEQRICAVRAINDEAIGLGQKIYALVVCDNHIHLVAQNINLPIGRVVSHYKHAIRLALQKEGFNGKLWTKGFDKRYCMNDNELAVKIAYIRGHMNTNAEITINH
ncbi:MAG: transposase [Sedimentisphaerales bacterium]|nr:transposase [Sedimentisphaerales bacterium]